MNDTPTPRTDAKMFQAWRWDTHTMEYVPHGIGFPAEDARKLERELTAVTVQRDRLAEALQKVINEDGTPMSIDLATKTLQSITQRITTGRISKPI